MPFGSCSPVCLISSCFPFEGLLLYIAADVAGLKKAEQLGLILTWAPGSCPSPGVNPSSVSTSQGKAQPAVSSLSTPSPASLTVTPKTDWSVLQIWEELEAIFPGSLPHWAEWTVIFTLLHSQPHLLTKKRRQTAAPALARDMSSSPSHLPHVSPLNHRLDALSVFRGLEVNDA